MPPPAPEAAADAQSENRHGLGVARHSAPEETRSRQTPDPSPAEEIVMNRQIVKVGQIEIRYLVDGAQTAGSEYSK